MDSTDLKTCRTRPEPFFDPKTTVRLSSESDDAELVRWLKKPALDLNDLAAIESRLMDSAASFVGATASVLASRVRDLVNVVSGIDRVRAQKVAERLERQR